MPTPSFQDLLNDTAKYPDTMEITISDGFKVPLSAIRESGSLARAAEKAAKAAQEKADSDALRAADLLRQIEEGKVKGEGGKEPSAAPPAGVPTWDQIKADPLLGILAQKIEAASALESSIKALDQSFRAASTRYLRREIEQDFSSIPDRFEDVDLRAVIKHAVDNRLVDSDGLPRVRAAYDDLTRERQIERREKAAFEKGKAEGRNLTQSEGMSIRPGFSSGGRQGAPEGSQIYRDASGQPSIDAAVEAAKRDTDLMAQLNEALRSGAIQ